MRAAVKLAIIVAFFGYQLYQFVPHYPEGFEGASWKRLLGETVFRIIFRVAVIAERFDFIEDSAYIFQSLSSMASNNNTLHSGDPDMLGGVPVLFFRNNVNAKNQKTIIYFHGGGFCLGTARSYSAWTWLLARHTGAVIISVDYRLAPKHPYPAAVEDCIAVTKAVFDSAEVLGLDRNRIGVAGDSAGANLATVVAFHLASTERYRLKMQVLFSPVTLPPGLLPLPSAVKYNSLYPIPADFFLAKYAGQKYTRAVEASIFSRRYISYESMQRISRFIQMSSLPHDLLGLIKDGSSTEMQLSGSGLSKTAMASLPDEVKAISKLALNDRSWLLLLENEYELAKMPPAFIQISEYDMRRDEGLLFFAKLRSVGVPVVLSFLSKAEHIEPVLNILTNSTHTAASRQGFEDAVVYLNEKL